MNLVRVYALSRCKSKTIYILVENGKLFAYRRKNEHKIQNFKKLLKTCKNYFEKVRIAVSCVREKMHLKTIKIYYIHCNVKNLKHL